VLKIIGIEQSNEVDSTNQPIAKVYGTVLEFAEIGLLAKASSADDVDDDIGDFCFRRNLCQTTYSQSKLFEVVFAQVSYFLHVFGEKELISTLEIAEQA
jgi:hypothetical protein